jgi:two-component system phosphate regulon sensor histidine kinase PhoR
MRIGPTLGAACAIGGVPAAVLITLLGTGALALAPALIALFLSLAAALALAAAFSRDLRLLTETLRHAALEHEHSTALPAALPRLPALQRIALAIRRFIRTLDARAAEVSRLLATNEAIVEALPDPLLVLGEDRQPRRANRAAREAFGADIPAVLRHPGMRAAIDKAFAGGGPQATELRLPVPVPRDVHASVFLLEPPLPDGAPAIVVLSDRTRERALDRMRADFVANASHELRTPLTGLIGFIDTLRGPAADDPAAQSRFLAIMAELAARMNRLIDDLLGLSRIELDEHQPPLERIDLAALLQRVVAACEPMAAGRSMKLQLVLQPGAERVIGDGDQLMQVAQNLIDNALKYGREGGTVQVELAAAPSGGHWPARGGVLLSVADDGPGIARQHLPRLTERFYRVDTGRSRAAGGTGLGLAIVKHIVNRHRGQLAIASEEGKGTTCSVWLPVDPP